MAATTQNINDAGAPAPEKGEPQPAGNIWAKNAGKSPAELCDTTFDEPISDEMHKLLTSTESVSSMLAADPKMTPGDAWEKLYGHLDGKRFESKRSAGEHGAGNATSVGEVLRRAEECGKWGATKPSELFLKMYSDSINSLHGDPSRGMVSPPLTGSSGVVPLTVISVVPDIVRHMSNVIVRAEREVFLATNYWANSVASKYITDAMRELSRRAGERGEKIVFKVIYDRGSPKQLVKPHYYVEEKEFTSDKVNLPHRHEVPNLDLQVVNYHQPLLGTFHAKYMVVDRKIAILQSNNIQDNDNVEMMMHMEGPIVDSMYDMALISWHMALDPPLPSHNSPAAQGGLGSYQDGKFNDVFGPSGSIKGHTAVVDDAKMKPGQAYAYGNSVDTANTTTSGNAGTAADGINEPGKMHEAHQRPVESDDRNRSDIATGPSTTANIVPMRPAQGANSVSNAALAEDMRKEEAVAPQSHPEGIATHTMEKAGDEPITNENLPVGPDETVAAYLDSGEQSMPQKVVSEPVPPPGDALPEHLTTDPHWDDTIANEVLRVQASVSAKPGLTAMHAINKHLNHTTNVNFGYDAPDFAADDEMTPYMPHPSHEPFPIAMVCRSPYGSPNHKAVSMPQNAAWLSALRNAKKNVFIQSPTLNAEPLVPAIIDACNRGIDVYCYICLGYNDTGELLPGQGGHNDMVAHYLYQCLTDPAAKARLHYFWYVGKDQTRPIIQSKKKRSCHVKLMIVDEHVGMMGNGNQDTQSWYHSQEINVMLDSEHVCKAWIDGLRRNQNTHIYGAFDKEKGLWVDKDGKQADGAIGVDPGRFAWAKGVIGAVKRVQGVGGF